MKPVRSVKGVLPEAIHAPPFHALLADLRRAKDRFEAGEDAGRGGVIASVEALTRFLLAFHPVTAAGLHNPLITLVSALKSLDDGRASDLLTPRKKPGRHRESPLRNSLVGLAACTVDGLVASGLQFEKACDTVAAELQAANIRPSRKGAKGNQGHAPQMTVRTVREWYAKVSEDVGRRSVAARVYDSMKQSYEPILYTFKLRPEERDPNALLPQQIHEILLMGLRKHVSDYHGAGKTT